MKALPLGLSALTLLFAAGRGLADVIYSNLQDIAIPTTYDGTYIDVDGGHAPSTSTFSGWDLNAYMGGAYLTNNSQFQPGRTAADNVGTLQNFAVGSTIDASMLLGTGMGGSIDHLGKTFTANTEGILGFKTGNNYGWMRVVFTGNTSGAVIKDWAYDNSGAAINVGRIQQAAAVGNTQLVTLSPAAGESFTLGSQIANNGAIINSLAKTGAGTTTLSGTHTYTGTTTVSAGSLLVNGNIATSPLTTVASGATLGGSGTVGNLTLNSGAILAPGNSPGLLKVEGNMILGSGSIFSWELASATTDGRGTNFDAVNVSGAISGSDGIFRIIVGDLDLESAFWSQNRSWDIFDEGLNSRHSYGFSSFQLFNADPLTQLSYSNAGNFSFNPETGSLVWSVTDAVAPEPGGALAALLMVAGLMRRRRTVQA